MAMQLTVRDVNSKFQKFRVWTTAILQIAYCKSLNRHISTKRYPILMIFDTQCHIWNSMTAK